MFDSNQKLFDLFLLEKDMKILMFIIYHSHTLIYRILRTKRNISNVESFVQQT